MSMPQSVHLVVMTKQMAEWNCCGCLPRGLGALKNCFPMEVLMD